MSFAVKKLLFLFFPAASIHKAPLQPQNNQRFSSSLETTRVKENDHRKNRFDTILSFSSATVSTSKFIIEVLNPLTRTPVHHLPFHIIIFEHSQNQNLLLILLVEDPYYIYDFHYNVEP